MNVTDTTTTFITLHELINQYPDKIDIINSKYTQLLSFLTKTTLLSKDKFLKNIHEIFSIGEIVISYIGTPNDDIESNTFVIVSSGTIIFEPKIIREGKNCGHIEDIVIHEKYRGLGLCTQTIDILVEFAKNNNCYKVILDCHENITKVYGKNGFIQNGIQMSKYF